MKASALTASSSWQIRKKIISNNIYDSEKLPFQI